MDTVTALLHGADWEPPCVQSFKGSVEKYTQKCCNYLGDVGGKEEEKERRKGRKCICIILHVPRILTNIDIRLLWFINIK